MFEIGDKVVCINKLEPLISEDNYHPNGIPIKDKIYVISKILHYSNWPVHMYGLSFVGGLTAFGIVDNTEVGFNYLHFRKLDDIKNILNNKNTDSFEETFIKHLHH